MQNKTKGAQTPSIYAVFIMINAAIASGVYINSNKVHAMNSEISEKEMSAKGVALKKEIDSRFNSILASGSIPRKIKISDIVEKYAPLPTNAHGLESLLRGAGFSIYPLDFPGADRGWLKTAKLSGYRSGFGSRTNIIIAMHASSSVRDTVDAIDGAIFTSSL